jgi:hypothetical protein
MDKIMIDLPDELILLLLEKVGDGDSLLRCRKTCRLLYRISLDRILLLKFNGIITAEDRLLLPEEVMNDSELFTTVIEDGRWKRMIDNLVRRRFRLFDTLMPDNGVQSFLTVGIIDNITRSAAWGIAHISAAQRAWDVYSAWHIAQNAAWYAAFIAEWNAACLVVLSCSQNITQRTVESAPCNVAPTSEIKNIIKDIIMGESNPEIMGEKAWYAAEYLYLAKTIHSDTWNTVYRLFDGLELPETIPPFWADPDLQNNTHIMEYKRLFSIGKLSRLV